MRRWLVMILAFMLTMSVAPAAAAADPAEGGVTADLDGAPIAISEIADHYCHDHDFPRIHCFAQAPALTAALREATNSMKGEGAAATAATDYVIVYSGVSYSGSYMYVSQDYDTLVVVAWNDRIRSYRSLNGAAGVFWTDWYRTGYNLNFCCGSSATSLSSTFDRQITSVYRS